MKPTLFSTHPLFPPSMQSITLLGIRDRDRNLSSKQSEMIRSTLVQTLLLTVNLRIITGDFGYG